MFSYYKTLSVMTNTGVTQMSKGRLLYALEGVDEFKKVLHEPKDELLNEDEVGEIEDEPNDAFLNAEMVDAMSCDKELQKDLEELSGFEVTMDEIDSSIERLDGIAAAIEKYGISQAMMEAVDPQGELVKAGMCCSYESLDVESVGKEVALSDGNGVTTKGEEEGTRTLNLVAVAAAVAGAMAVHALGTYAGKKLGQLAGSWLRARLTYEKALSTIDKKLASITDFKADAFKEESVTAYKYADFKKAIELGAHLVKVVDTEGPVNYTKELANIIGTEGTKMERIEAIDKKAGDYFKPVANNKEVAEILGIHVDFNENGGLKAIRKEKPSIAAHVGKAGDLGWDISHVKEAVKEALTVMRGSFELVNHLESIGKKCEAVAAEMKKKAKEEKKFTSEDKAVHKKALASMRNLIESNRVLAITTMWALKEAAGSAMFVGRAAIKSAGVVEPKAEAKKEGAQEELAVTAEVVAVSQEELDAIAEVEAATEALAAANQEVADLKAAEDKVEEAKAKVEKIREKIAAKKAEEKGEEKKETKAEEKNEEK